MKLTNHHRTTFVRAVLSSVPNKETAIVEQLRGEMLNSVLDALPATIRTMYNDPSMQGYLYLGSYYLPGAYGMSMTAPYNRDTIDPVFGQDSTSWQRYVPVTEKISALWTAYIEERDARLRLKRMLEDTTARCSTLKQLREALPALVQYMPEEVGKRSTDRTLPVVQTTALMDALTAAGWVPPTP